MWQGFPQPGHHDWTAQPVGAQFWDFVRFSCIFTSLSNPKGRDKHIINIYIYTHFMTSKMGLMAPGAQWFLGLVLSWRLLVEMKPNSLQSRLAQNGHSPFRFCFYDIMKIQLSVHLLTTERHPGFLQKSICTEDWRDGHFLSRSLKPRLWAKGGNFGSAI